nr:reverse transcriptase domain-containing protein [Tanacetum cinerariifolium]
MWATDRVVVLTLSFAITIPKTVNEFAIKGNHLTLIKGNQFDGITKTDPHKHIHEFLRICDMFKYRDTENEAVLLMMFPLSLTKEAKTWLDGLSKGTIKTWDELRTTFISRFFPPALFDRILEEIRAFSQHENKPLTDAWLRMKEMLRNRYGHNLSKGNIIKIFYHGLNKITQEVLNAAVGDAMNMKMDAQYKEFQSHSKPIPDHNDDDIPIIDVIDEILKDFDALLDEGSEILDSIEETILEEKLFAKFDKFMAMTAEENFEFEHDTEEPPFEKNHL